MLRYKLRTLLILLAVGPPAFAGLLWLYSVLIVNIDIHFKFV